MWNELKRVFLEARTYGEKKTEDGKITRNMQEKGRVPWGTGRKNINTKRQRGKRSGDAIARKRQTRLGRGKWICVMRVTFDRVLHALLGRFCAAEGESPGSFCHERVRYIRLLLYVYLFDISHVLGGCQY